MSGPIARWYSSGPQPPSRTMAAARRRLSADARTQAAISMHTKSSGTALTSARQALTRCARTLFDSLETVDFKH